MFVRDTAHLTMAPSSGTYLTAFILNVTGSTDDWDAIADMPVTFDWSNPLVRR